MRLVLKLLLLCGLTACNEQSNFQQQAQPLNFNHIIYLNDQLIKVTVFDTPAEREKGLMWVKELPKDHGALFVFEQEGDVGFWMKNTLIPLDLLFFDSQGALIKALPAIQPCNSHDCEIVQAEKTKFVLELAANSLANPNLHLIIPN